MNQHLEVPSFIEDLHKTLVRVDSLLSCLFYRHRSYLEKIREAEEVNFLYQKCRELSTALNWKSLPKKDRDQVLEFINYLGSRKNEDFNKHYLCEPPELWDADGPMKDWPMKFTDIKHEARQLCILLIERYGGSVSNYREDGGVNIILPCGIEKWTMIEALAKGWGLEMTKMVELSDGKIAGEFHVKYKERAR